MYDFVEKAKEIAGYIWRAMLDYWFLSMVVVFCAFKIPGAAIFGICKLVDSSMRRHSDE